MKLREILVVSGNPHMTYLYAAASTAAGCRVVTCKSFAEARRRLQESVPDALVTDLRLQAYNGLYLVILFREVAPSGAVFVIGHDDPVLMREASDLGAEFLVEPVTFPVLAKRLADLSVAYEASGRSELQARPGLEP